MADDPFKTKSLRDLVRETESLPLIPARTSPVKTQLARISESGRAIADAIPQPVKTLSRHSARYGGRTAVAVLLIVLVFCAGVYLSLMRAPISLSFLVPALQDRFNGQLPGYKFHIGDAILRLGSGGGLEFRLADVSLLGEEDEEIAKAPFASVDLSERALLRLSLAPSAINLLEPKLLLFNTPGKGLTLTASPFPKTEGETPTSAGAGWQPEKNTDGGLPSPWETTQKSTAEDVRTRSLSEEARPAKAASPGYASTRFPDPVVLLARVFATLEKRGRTSAALQRIGVTDATIYFVTASGVAAWQVSDFHVDFEADGGNSGIGGELAIVKDGIASRLSLHAVNKPQQKLYSLTAALDNVIPKTAWQSFPSPDALELIDVPISGSAKFDLTHGGDLSAGQADFKIGKGQFYTPFDKEHAAAVDGGLLSLVYTKERSAVTIAAAELRWPESVLHIAGEARKSANPSTAEPEWTLDLDGSGTSLAAVEFGVKPIGLDVLRAGVSYQPETGELSVRNFALKSGTAGITLSAHSHHMTTGGAVAVNGEISPMPLSLLKTIWPVFLAPGARDWIGLNVPEGDITGGQFSIQLSGETIASISHGGDVPESAVTFRLGLASLDIYHLKGFPPIQAAQAAISVNGRKFLLSILSEARIDVPSGRSLIFSEGSLAIDDLRERVPVADIRFKATAEASAALELLDQPPLGYVKAVGFKSDIVNGQASTAFRLSFPLFKDVKFKQMQFSGKARVSDLKSNALPGGLTVNGGTVNFDIGETAIGATGDLKVKGVPISLQWQHIYDAPADRQPTLRVAGILSEKAREDLGFNVNHIVRGDLPVAIAIALQKDGPPKVFAEANLTNADIFLTAIGWRKPPGQKATLTFDVAQRADNFMALENFSMTGEGLNIAGRLILNEKRRIAGFSFPEFSTNALTKLELSGELTPQNVLRVQAKGPSYDGRQFFRSLFSAGKLAENQPPPLKDEPGLDLSVEIETVFGFYDTTIKSVAIEGRRRNGKLSSLDISGRINGESPIAARIDQKAATERVMTSESTDAGGAFRLVGFYPAIRGGQMTLRLNLDAAGSAAEKTGVLYVQSFQIVGDQVVGKVLSRAEQERERRKPGSRAVQPGSGGEPLQFDRMWVPFSVGGGQFTLRDTAINGPLIGATMRGRIDFNKDLINLSGTYVPLYGLNSMLEGVPLLGDLLTSRQGEGVLGMTFAVQGRTANPEVLVNPLSMVAPGFLRQIFEFENGQGQAGSQQSPTQTEPPRGTPGRRAAPSRPPAAPQDN